MQSAAPRAPQWRASPTQHKLFQPLAHALGCQWHHAGRPRCRIQRVWPLLLGLGEGHSKGWARAARAARPRLACRRTVGGVQRLDAHHAARAELLAVAQQRTLSGVLVLQGSKG